MSEFCPNTLYYGDNLDVLRDFPPECVDLVYLDPPFNSNRSYNVLFKETKGERPRRRSRRSRTPGTGRRTRPRPTTRSPRAGDDVGRLLRAFVEALGHNDVTAYLTMMAPRLVELRRVMKPTASIYLHCDPTASHYLKVLMDAIFGRTTSGTRSSGNVAPPTATRSKVSKQAGRVHDVLLFYSLTSQSTWNRHSPRLRRRVRPVEVPVYRGSDRSTVSKGRFDSREARR